MLQNFLRVTCDDTCDQTKIFFVQDNSSMDENSGKVTSMLETIQDQLSEKNGESSAYKLLKHQREWFMDMLTTYISVPTLIVGFYGMNLLIPGDRHPVSLVLVVTLIALWVIYVHTTVQNKYPYPTSLSKVHSS